MKVLYFICTGLLLLGVFITGCTSQPAQTPATTGCSRFNNCPHPRSGCAALPYRYHLEPRVV